MPNDEHNLRNIGVEHHKSDSGLPDFNAQNIIIFVLILVILGFALYVFKPGLFKSLKIGTDSKSAVPSQEQKKEAKPSGYSAVFLTNNQVYFGKLEDANSDYPRLKEVYYLRANTALQPKAATGSAQSDVSLIKLGEELHGPSDEIKFNRDQILYIEDLKTDSKVVKAIEDFKAKKK
ncbi:MAG: hypothetical protein Q7S45_00050 [Candidatus Curtissbacteria bacterium]|nr:hypothetical protein [Candidatus Curtissbacteria bacterium]